MSKYTKQRNTKDKVINIRLSPEENERLRISALSDGKSISQFVREKALNDDSSLYDDIPRQVDVWNLVNEIYHEMKYCSDIECRTKIFSILENYTATQTEVR